MAPFLHFSGVALMVIFVCLQLLGQPNGQMYTRQSHPKLVYDAITVDQSGWGHFTTVQAAIDAVPMNNRNWVTIKVMEGFYREKVVIPMEKPYIIIKGQNRHKTQIVWDDHDSLDQSPTFSSFADNIIVKCISFVNSYNHPVNSNPRVPAVAARINGDKSYFYRCGFFGLQDTLWDVGGRHYYRLCTIQGAVDFIFGSAQSIFERCSISVRGGALDPGSAGYITAQGRENPNDANGFVFKECHVFGTGLTYLGRPWRGYSRVIFYNSHFSQIVVPQGWDAWHFEGNEEQFTYAEQGCYGPGADTSRRVKWEKKLDIGTLQELTSLDFIDTDGWLNDLPS